MPDTASVTVLIAAKAVAEMRANMTNMAAVISFFTRSSLG
jgi:hypothetical protein